MIDLKSCKPGDKLKTRNGEIVEYSHVDSYFHAIRHPNGIVVNRNSNGSIIFSGHYINDGDIVEIVDNDKQPVNNEIELLRQENELLKREIESLKGAIQK